MCNGYKPDISHSIYIYTHKFCPQRPQTPSPFPATCLDDVVRALDEVLADVLQHHQARRPARADHVQNLVLFVDVSVVGVL